MPRTQGWEHDLPKKSQGFVRLLRSSFALLLGFLAIVFLPFWTDEVLRSLGWLSSGAFGMYDVRSNLLDLTHRMIFTVLGSYIAASLAPRYPIRHALALGVVELTLSINGVIFRATTYDTGPVWYAATLAVIALPCSWVGGFLWQRQAASVRVSEEPVL